MPFSALKKDEDAAPRKFKKQEREWMDRHVNDEYVKKAKVFSYRSRASFKLIEIDEKLRLLRKGMRVIDVGAAPGGWSQVIAEKVESTKGHECVVAVDLLEMLPVDGVHFV
jgi:23S rRNA (uridine2552-2'-O)-methyltransferase